MKKLLLFPAILVGFLANAQSNFQNYCNQAYSLYPNAPRGSLEAIAYTQARMQHIESSELESCSGLPKAYGYFGLIENGKNYFIPTMELIASRSGYSKSQIKNSHQIEVLALAKTIHQLTSTCASESLQNKFIYLFSSLSYLPDTGKVNLFARDLELYELFKFLNEDSNATKYGFPNYNFDLQSIFSTNLTVLSAPRLFYSTSGIQTQNGASYVPAKRNNVLKSTEYGPAIWNPAPSCNYSSRNGTAISAITIHTIQGSYAGAISWSQNCNSNVSFHYVVRSSDGQITQMVNEANKGWHVGSENPYTIGYEHEGYVSQSGWYTTAMYNASAALSRDICQSGYGINPKRTFFGAATSGSNVLGSCIKIKGHQHYPNQTHTDPGIYWDWERYYKLINNAPTQTTLTNASGTWYDSGGASGNYQNDERYLTLIQPTGANSVSLNFTAFNLENNWDFLLIYDGNSLSAPLIGKYTGTNSPGTITSSSGSILIEFRSDCATTASGWAINWSSSTSGGSGDLVNPTTLVTAPNSWVTQDFTTSFTDADNTGGSGIEKSYYQVIDYDGTDWRANAQNGFFSDNFDQAAIHPDWTTISGTWNITNGNLVQSDENNGNSNIYAYVNHGLSNRYLYNWAGSLSGSGTSRRAGLHYFCDNPSATNRGNSYFVYFRLDDAKVQLYKVTNDVFTLQNEVSYTFTAGQWYDFKVIYDRISGKHQVYINNILVQTWTDTTPLSSGNYISFRNGNCNYAVNNLKIYRSRYPSVTVTVGINGDLRFQNTNPSTPAGRIKSIVQDLAGNLSSIAQQDVNVDWTSPSAISQVNDGTGADISTTTNSSSLSANWSLSSDTHSDVASYWYSIGSSPGATDIVPWTDNNWDSSATVNGLNLSIGNTYYFNIRAENGAGLFSAVSSSNGQQVIVPTNPPVANFVVQNTYVCASDSMVFNNLSTDATSYLWNVPGAVNATSTAVNPAFQFTSSGSYTITLIAYGPLTSDTTTQQISIQVSQPLTAQFAVNNDTIFLSGVLTCTNNSINANGYTWDFGDGTTTQDINPWHQYQQTGNYVVQLIAVNDACPQDTTLQTIVVTSGLGLNGIEASNYSIFPNPGVDFVWLQHPESVVNIEIVDIRGQQVYQSKVISDMHLLRTTSWAKGVYWVRWTDSVGNTVQLKFVKE